MCIYIIQGKTVEKKQTRANFCISTSNTLHLVFFLSCVRVLLLQCAKHFIHFKIKCENCPRRYAARVPRMTRRLHKQTRTNKESSAFCELLFVNKSEVTAKVQQTASFIPLLAKITPLPTSIAQFSRVDQRSAVGLEYYCLPSFESYPEFALRQALNRVA
jgi:hypothetical protein